MTREKAIEKAKLVRLLINDNNSAKITFEKLVEKYNIQESELIIINDREIFNSFIEEFKNTKNQQVKIKLFIEFFDKNKKYIPSDKVWIFELIKILTKFV